MLGFFFFNYLLVSWRQVINLMVSLDTLFKDFTTTESLIWSIAFKYMLMSEDQDQTVITNLNIRFIYPNFFLAPMLYTNPLLLEFLITQIKCVHICIMRYINTEVNIFKST